MRHRWHPLTLVVGTIALAACGGGTAAPPHPSTTAPRTKSEATVPRTAAARLTPDGSGPACPTRAIFLRLHDEIRGYPLPSVGATAPCQLISGNETLLSGNGNGYGAIVVSIYGFLHATAFQSNGPGALMIFAPDANGNVAPFRAASADQDHVALAVDSNLTDYIVAAQYYVVQNCWYIIPDGATDIGGSNCDANVRAIYALATDPNDELIVVGTDAQSGDGRIDVFANPSSSTPTLVRSIHGPSTGLPSIYGGSYFDVSFSVTSDPTSGEIYVYVADRGAGHAPVTKIAEFAAGASGDVPPLRIISGPNTNLPNDAFAVDVLAVDDFGRLFVTSPNPVTVSMFGRYQSGDVVPDRTFTDPSAATQSTAVGIALRTAIAQ